MILRFFKTNQPAAAFAIPLAVLILWLPDFLHPAVADVQDHMPVYQWLLAAIKHLPDVIIKLVCILIVSFQAIYIHRIVVKHEVLHRDSYLPSLMFAVVASSLPEFQQFSPVLLVNLIMLFVLDKSFALFKEPFPIAGIFDCSFLVSIASLIYLPALLYIILFLVSLLVLRPFNWREWTVALIGFVLPYFFISVYFFWTDELKGFYSWLITNRINQRLFYEIHFTKSLLLVLSVLAILLVSSLFKLRDNFYKNAIKTRIVQQVTVIYLIIATLSALLQHVITLHQFELLAFPLAVFYGYYFVTAVKRPWIYEAAFLLLIVAILINLY